MTPEQSTDARWNYQKRSAEHPLMNAKLFGMHKCPPLPGALSKARLIETTAPNPLHNGD